MEVAGQRIYNWVLRFCTALLLLSLTFLSKEAFARSIPEDKDRSSAPLVEGFRINQIGASQLILEIRGTDMPLPIVTESGGGAVRLLWQGAAFPVSADRKEWWSDLSWDVLKMDGSDGKTWQKGYEDIPLVDEVRAAHDGDGAVMEIIGTRRLLLKSVGGMGGSVRQRLMLEAQPQMAAIPPAPKPKPLPEGDPMTILSPVSLELRDVPLRDAFRMLAKLRGLDLILDPAVPNPAMTVSFSEAPFREVFAYLLRMHNLSYSLSGKTLVVGSHSAIAKAMGTVSTRRYTVSYSDIKTLPALISTLIPLEVKPVADERMRSLYITASPEEHRRIEALMNRIDSPGKQIMIEARLVEINDTARQEFETTLAALYKGWIFTYGSTGLGSRYTYGNSSVTPNVNPTGATTIGEIPLIGSNESETSFPGYLADSAMRMVDSALRALETDNKGKVLASPSVVALDGQKASVRLTHNYLYQSGVDENGNPEFSNQETGPTLEFTPTLGRDGYITINMKISTGEIVAFRQSGDSEAPETTKREVDTNIRVRDGELFVIGGLYQENKTNNISRVPVLSYIPILGELFKSRTTQQTKSQMAFIAVPYILDIPSGSVEVIEMPETGIRM